MTKGKLLYSKNADIFYATGLFFPDKYIYLEDKDGESHACFSSLEIDRAKENCNLDHIHSLESLVDILKQEERTVNMTNIIKYLLEMTDTNIVSIPADFPANIYQGLKSLDVELHIEDVIFPNRIVKKVEEIEKIKQAQRMNEEAFHFAFDILQQAEIGEEDKLFWQGKVLTSEILRAHMNMVVAKHGGVPEEGGPIVSCGKQGAMAHEIGTGPLYANQLIVIDSFPRHANFYYSDISRTVIKGTPCKEHEEMYSAVKNAQNSAFEMLKAGAIGSSVHKAVVDSIENSGFKTGIDKNGNREGFYHATGHNLGLEGHDVGQALGLGSNLLQAGQVLTVEPGLYYPEIGGVRIEDTVLITEDGFENLTQLEKFLIIE